MEPYYNWNFFTPIDLLPWSDLLSPFVKGPVHYSAFKPELANTQYAYSMGALISVDLHLELFGWSPLKILLLPVENRKVLGSSTDIGGKYR